MAERRRSEAVGGVTLCRLARDSSGGVLECESETGAGLEERGEARPLPRNYKSPPLVAKFVTFFATTNLHLL